MKRRSTLKLVVAICIAALAPLLVFAGDSADKGEAGFMLPLGIPADAWTYFIPKENPVTAEKAKLGRQLFFDKRLSADASVSCASCHEPSLAFADGRRVAEGIDGRRGARNTPTLLNAMFNVGQFWDGRVESLEEQAKAPLVNPDEMGNRSLDEVVARVAALPEYAEQIKKVFGGAVTIDSIAKAIATFERTLVSGNSPLDRYLAGDLNALGEQARNGMVLFRGKARCSVCHLFNQAFTSFPFFTDMNYRNTGVAANYKGFDALYGRAIQAMRSQQTASREAFKRDAMASELGRFAISGNALDIGAFRTPSLRNVELTAPYFHDGSVATLEEVVRFYVKGGIDNANRDWQLEPVELTDAEQRDLVEFLKALTGDEARREYAPPNRAVR